MAGERHLASAEEGEDILECGIDIHVELSRKSQRAMSLLSGGGKALVAIVLYFAILKVCGSTPFCVLDEIEAALDDVNVLRYGVCAACARAPSLSSSPTAGAPWRARISPMASLCRSRRVTAVRGACN